MQNLGSKDQVQYILKNCELKVENDCVHAEERQGSLA